MDRVQYDTFVIQDLLNFYNEDGLNLSPWYQRRSVWNTNQKAYLINTLHEQKPIPTIYIRHSLDLEKEKSIKEIVDGQQRTRTIIEYSNNEFSAFHPNHNRKVLFNELSRSEKETFLFTSIPVGYLLGAEDADVIDIFARINSISKNLNTQEKLNAAYSGDFKQFCISEATKRLNFIRSYNIFSATKISRMEEINFISDVTISLLDGLTDSSAPKTKKYYEDFDDEFLRSNEISQRIDVVFDQLVLIEPAAIKETIFNRPPILFSLIIVLDELQRTDKQLLEKTLFEIDAKFNLDEINQTIEDIEFSKACSASTARKPQRDTRHNYILSFLS